MEKMITNEGTDVFGKRETIDELRLTNAEKEALANLPGLPKKAKVLMRSDQDIIQVQTVAAAKLAAQIRAENDLQKAVRENMVLARDILELEGEQVDNAALRKENAELKREKFTLDKDRREAVEAAKHEHERSLQLQAGQA